MLGLELEDLVSPLLLAVVVRLELLGHPLGGGLHGMGITVGHEPWDLLDWLRPMLKARLRGLKVMYFLVCMLLYRCV